jgi:hypothetical protein
MEDLEEDGEREALENICLPWKTVLPSSRKFFSADSGSVVTEQESLSPRVTKRLDKGLQTISTEI